MRTQDGRLRDSVYFSVVDGDLLDGQAMTASMVAFGDKILQASEDGDVFVVQAGPEHKIVTTNKLGEPIYASPALSNGTIYIRGEKHIYAIR